MAFWHDKGEIEGFDLASDADPEKFVGIDLVVEFGDEKHDGLVVKSADAPVHFAPATAHSAADALVDVRPAELA